MYLTRQRWVAKVRKSEEVIDGVNEFKQLENGGNDDGDRQRVLENRSIDGDDVFK